MASSTIPFIDKLQNRLTGVLNCFDRVILTGTLPRLCYSGGMTSYLNEHHIRIFDYPKLVIPWRDRIRENAEAIARAHGLTIEFVHKSKFDKEKRIEQILKKRGTKPGLVHILSAMERCTAYRPWFDKASKECYLKPTTSKCLHYYFYFIDELLGLCYVRVPTWAPFRLQIYFNGHGWLSQELLRKGIAFQPLDNAFLTIGDFDRANKIAWRFPVPKLHRKLDEFAKRYCPVIQELQATYHWSQMQVEYAVDLVFRRQQDLQAFYPSLLETLIHSVKPENIATFLGKKLTGNYLGEMGCRFEVRREGSCLKCRMGPVLIKIYDKFGIILRVEVTVNDVSFFREFRSIQHRNGSRDMKWCKMRKSIYSLPALQQLLAAATRRYLEFISAIATPEIGIARLQKLTRPVIENHHSYKGFNLLAEEDAKVMRTIVRGEFMISGFSARDLRRLLTDKTSAQISRLIKRLRVHGLIKRVGKRYKYYLTELGRIVATSALKLREMVIIPQLANAMAQ